jgi:DNA-binding winged helix-turn-helix (wHTH) protein/Tol biopolymer transport system component
VRNGTANGVTRFGVFEVDIRAGELRRNGVKVKLQEQPFRLLTVLLEKPGELITREEVRSRLWPADTFVDFDHSLKTAVNRLRDALGDSAENPRFVETVARRGYRFVAPVNGAPVNGDGLQARSVSRKKSYAKGIAAISALAAACIAVGWEIERSVVRPAPRETKLTDNSAEVPVYSAALSPDGGYLAYTDPRGTFVREVGTDEYHILPLPEGFRVHFLSWFPDGNHLLAAAGTDRDETSNLWSISVLGGAPRKLVEHAEVGTISPDGKQIAFLRGMDIWLADADGGKERMAKSVAASVVGSPMWSPDGRRLAYLKGFSLPGWMEGLTIETYELASGTTEPVFSSDRLRGGVAWTRDGRILFSMVEGVPGQRESGAWSLPVDLSTGRARGKPKRLTKWPDWIVVTSVSTDGKRAAFIGTNVVPTAYVADVDPGTRGIGKLQRLTMDDRQNWPLGWTPNGKAVLYISDREGPCRIFRLEVGAAAPELLLGGQEFPIHMTLNPEGSEILYSSPEVPPYTDRKIRGVEWLRIRLMRVALTGGNGSLLLEDVGIANFQCARAPARECVYGKFTKDALVFVAFDSQSGEKRELLRVGEPGWQNYGWTWSLSPDGKTLALAKDLRAADAAGARLIPVGGGAERVLKANHWPEIRSLEWAADGKSLWAIAGVHGELGALLNIDLQGGTRQALEWKPSPYIGWALPAGWAIPSPDGKRLVVSGVAGGGNAWMLEGF